MLVSPPSLFGVFDRSELETNGVQSYRYAKTESADGTQIDLLYLSVPDPQGTVVIVHGLGDRKESYLDHAEHMRRRNYDVLLMDLRGHGQSGGKQMTMGFREAEDIHAAILWCVEQNLQRPFVIWGVSFGATSTLLAAEGKAEIYDGLIVESPYNTLRETAAHHGWLMYKLPYYPIVPLVLKIFSMRTGVNPEAIDAYRACKQLSGIPVLFVAGGGDPRMPPEHVKKLYECKQGEKDFLIIPEANHGQLFGTDTELYLQSVDGLLQKAQEKYENRVQ